MSQGPKARVPAEERTIWKCCVLQWHEGWFGESEESNGMVFGKSYVMQYLLVVWKMYNEYERGKKTTKFKEIEIFNHFQVSEKEQLVKELKEDVEKEENNCKPKENLQLCQVSHKRSFSVKYTGLFIMPEHFRPSSLRSRKVLPSHNAR